MTATLKCLALTSGQLFMKLASRSRLWFTAIFLVLMSVCALPAHSQYADPAISGANFTPISVLQGSSSELTISFVNSGSTFLPGSTADIPAFSIEVTVCPAFNYYTSTGAPYGPGGVLFDWVALPNDCWRGTNNVLIPSFGGGDIKVLYTGNVVTPSPQATNINIQIIDFFLAFENVAGNDNLQPDLEVLPVAVPNLSVSKTNGSTTVNAGGTTSYTVTISNSGTGLASAVSWADAAVSGISVTGIATGTASGAGTVLGSCTLTGCTGISIAAGGSVTYSVTANITGAAGSNAVNTANVTGGGCSAGVPANCTSTDTDLIIAPALTVTKTVATLTGSANPYTVTYTVVVANSGTAQGSYTLTDTPGFAPGLTFTTLGTTVTTVGGTVNSGAIQYTPTNGAAQQISIANLPIAAGSTHTYTIAMQFNVGASATNLTCVSNISGNGLYNTAAIAGSVSTQSTACTDGPAVLSHTKLLGVGPTPTGAPNQFTQVYTLTVRNTGGMSSSYALTDTPLFGAGTTINGVSCAATGIGAAACPQSFVGSAPWSVAPVGTLIAPGGVHVYTLTVTFTVNPTSVSTDESDCLLTTGNATNTGLLNRATLTLPSGTTSVQEACTPTPGNLLHTKAVSSGPTATGNPYQFTVTYTLTVSNTGGAGSTYGLVDSPLFGAGTTINASFCAPTGVGAASCAGVSGAAAPWTVAPVGTVIAAGATHSYAVTLTVTLDPAALNTTGNDCSLTTGSGTNTGLLNRATMTLAGGTATNQDACTPIPGSVVHSKLVTAGPSPTGTANEYTVTYAINVSNVGGATTSYTLLDTPLFGIGTSISKGTCSATGSGAANCAGVSGAPSPSWIVADPGTQIAAGNSHTYTVVVTFKVMPGSITAADSDCSLETGSTTTTGLLNRATLTSVGFVNRTQDACAPIQGTASHTKVVTAQPTPTGVPNEYKVTYAITVTGPTAGSDASYSLIDSPLFGAGASIVGAKCAVTGIAAAVCPPTLSGSGPWTIAPTGTSIALGATHTYTIEVTFALQSGQVTSSSQDCSLATGSLTNTGLLNRATLTPVGATAVSQDACTPLPPVYFIDVVKASSAAVVVGASSFEIAYQVLVKNTGLNAIPNVQVTDNLGITFASGSPAIRIVRNPSIVSPDLCSPGTSFNGTSDFRLLGGADTLLPGQSCAVVFTVRVDYPDQRTVPARVLNTAYASGTAAGPNVGHTYSGTGQAIAPASAIAMDTSNNSLLPPVSPGGDPEEPTPNDMPSEPRVVPAVPGWLVALSILLYLGWNQVRRRRAPQLQLRG